MAFTFLHAADLHLGSPFQGLAGRDASLAARFAAASREAFQALVDQALEERVAFVVIAGDVYDGAWKDTSIGLFFSRETARLARAGIPVYLVAGNHDAESIVSHSVPLPDGVHRFDSGKAETIRLEPHRVALHGLSFQTRDMRQNPVPAFPAPVDGWFNIGVLHTSLEGAAEHIAYAPCALADLVGRGYDYWALGHVHDFAVRHENPHVVYPGNLQGRSIRECGPKGAVFVDVADGRVVALRTVYVDRARFAHAEVDATGLATAEELTTALRAAIAAALGPAPDRPVALRVTLSGASPLSGRLMAERALWRDQAEALAQHLSAEVWLESLKLRTVLPMRTSDAAAPAFDAEALVADLAGDAALAAEADRLMAQISDKLPTGVSLDGDIGRHLARARELLLARAVGGIAPEAPAARREAHDATA